MGIKKGFRVRIINFPTMGEKRWTNESRTEDLNEAFRIRAQKHATSTKSQYIYQVEEWVKGMP